MAADLSIHVLEGADERDLAFFFSNTMGSKYFAPSLLGNRFDDPRYERISSTPQVWVGEVSWLKAAVFGDREAFVPDPVGAVHDAIGEDLPIIDDALIDKIRGALEQGNATEYRVASFDDVRPFLEEHRGKPVFTVSW